MSLRVTTSSMVRNYNSCLSSSLYNLDRARETVYSGKKFTKFYQDPTSALSASQLWRKYGETEVYLDNIETATGRLNTADDVIRQIGTQLSNAANDEGLKALSGATTTEEVRKTYAKTLRQLQESLAQFGNTKYSDSYLFAGADGKNAPFTVKDDGTVTYRGIDVNDSNALKDILDEKIYIDLGMGLQVDTANGLATSFKDVNGASAFNVAVNGLDIFGYGNVPGSNPPISQNALALLGQMANELDKPDGAFNADYFADMRSQLDKNHSKIVDFNAELGVRQSTLTTKKERLADEKISLYTQIDSLQNAKPTEAITDYSYSNYVYNMVLKVGTSLLGNSFIDFMS